jgi:hypothetical protein
LAISSLLNASEEAINGYIKAKEERTPAKTVIRVNQEKEMTKQLEVIDAQINENNVTGVKTAIQNLLKRFGKDEFLIGKVQYLTYIQTISELYEK